MRRVFISAVVLVVSFYLGLTGFMWWTQDALVFQPLADYGLLPGDHGLTHEEVDIEVEPGTKIRGWFVPAPGEAIGTILYFHGNAGNLSTNLPHLQKFAAEGFHSFSIDYEGYGASDGEPSEANLYRDADAAWNWLTNTKGVHADEIVIWGHSLGGGVASWCATKYSPRVVVLDNTFTSIPDMGARLYPWLPVRWIARNHFANIKRLAAVRAPILIANARADELVPFEMGQELFRAANEPKRFVELDGNHGHGFDNTPEAWKALKEIFADPGQ